MTVLETMARAMLQSHEDIHPAQQPYIGGQDLDDIILDGRFDMIKAMRAVLMAIREPSDEVVTAGHRAGLGNIRQAWSKQIDAILSEPQP